MLVIAAVLITVLVTGAVVLVALNLWSGSSVAEARREAETIRREAKIEAREEAVRLRADVEREVGEQRSRITKIEELSKEMGLDRQEVIRVCMQEGVPIYQGKIDKTLFQAQLAALGTRPPEALAS